MSDILKKAIKETMDFDPISYVERLGLPAEAGLGLHIQRCKDMESLMEITGDTSFSMRTEDYIAVLKKIGFEQVYSEKFTRSQHEVVADNCYLFYRQPGMILWMDTFGGQRNSANLYFCFRPREQDKQKIYKCLSSQCSGHFTDEGGLWHWIGHFDAREALIYNLSQFDGEFVEPWTADQFLQLTTSEDYPKDMEWQMQSQFARKATQRRYGLLPDYVRSIIPEASIR